MSTETGNVPIENVRPGDMVWAWDEATGDVSLRKVTAASRTLKQSVLLVEVGDPAESLYVTPEHPMYTRRGWVNAESLTATDYLYTLTKRWIPVRRVDAAANTRLDVFNLEVEGHNTYYVGTSALLTHNNCELATRARDLIAKLPDNLFRNLQCTQCTDAIVKSLRDNGITGQILNIRANGGDFIVSDLVSRASPITQNGFHQAVRVGNTVFDNFHRAGVAYDKFRDSLHAIGGVTITAQPF